MLERTDLTGVIIIRLSKTVGTDRGASALWAACCIPRVAAHRAAEC